MIPGSYLLNNSMFCRYIFGGFKCCHGCLIGLLTMESWPIHYVWHKRPLRTCPACSENITNNQHLQRVSILFYCHSNPLAIDDEPFSHSCIHRAHFTWVFLHSADGGTTAGGVLLGASPLKPSKLATALASIILFDPRWWALSALETGIRAESDEESVCEVEERSWGRSGCI